MNLIAKPFGILMMWLYEFTNNYGLAIILFAVIVKLIMLPFQMKSKRGMMRMTLLNPQLEEIKKRHGSNQQKYNEEVQKLYREQGVNPMSGCLWSLLPFPILIALYGAIRNPITTMMGVGEELLAEGGSIFQKLTGMGFDIAAANKSGYGQISMSKFISENFEKFEGLSDKLRQIDYSFLGIDLGATPNYRVWAYDWSDTEALAGAVGLFMIPVVAAVLTWLSTYVTQKMNPPADPNTAATTNSMNIMMPIMTLVFAFMMPAALGLYWAMGSVLGIIQDIILTKYYKKVLAAETAEVDARLKAREAELEAKRKETERLRALNATVENENTSKKKREAKQKAEKAQAQAEWEKAHSEQAEEEYEPSRVGNRRYARGRAYDPDRYSQSGDSSANDADSSEKE